METAQLLAKVESRLDKIEAKISQVEEKVEELRKAYNVHHHNVQDLGPVMEDVVKPRSL